jgi:streptogramin lyase
MPWRNGHLTSTAAVRACLLAAAAAVALAACSTATDTASLGAPRSVVAATPSAQIVGSPSFGQASTPKPPQRLDGVALPGPAYDMTYDAERDAFWFAVTLTRPPYLYRYDVATAKLSSWRLPATVSTGFLARIELAPDGSVWLTEEYNIVRFDPLTGRTASRELPRADKDAIKAPDGVVAPWPTAIAFDAAGEALIGRNYVTSLLRLDASLTEVGRIPLPSGFAAASDLAVADGRIFVASQIQGPVAIIDEKGTVLAKPAVRATRLAVEGDRVFVAGYPSAWIAGDGTVTTLDPPVMAIADHGAVAADGSAVLYESTDGQIQWLDGHGHVTAESAFQSVPSTVWSPSGQLVNVVTIAKLDALALDGNGSLWAVTDDMTSTYSLVRLVPAP